MESVFKKHAHDVESYVRALGEHDGRLMLAMAILSDIQEMAGKGSPILQEADEVKELILSVMHRQPEQGR